MKPFSKRIFDYYLLKRPYKIACSSPSFVGLALALTWVLTRAYEMQIERGLTPGAPLGSEAGSIEFVGVVIGGFFGIFILGTVLCLAIYTAFLVVARRRSWSEAFGIFFLSK